MFVLLQRMGKWTDGT